MELGRMDQKKDGAGPDGPEQAALGARREERQEGVSDTCLNMRPESAREAARSVSESVRVM